MAFLMSGPQSAQERTISSGISVIMLMPRNLSAQHIGARDECPALSLLPQFVRLSQIMGISGPGGRAVMSALYEGVSW